MNIKEIDYLYFGGAAFGNVGYIGILKALQDNYSKEYIKNIIFHGDSAGSLIALIAVLDVNIEIALLSYLKYITIAIKNGILFKLNIYITDAYYDIIKNMDNKKILNIVNKRLRIGITKFPNTYIINNHWNSIDELLNDILCTTHIPLLSSYKSNSKYVPIIDGSFTFKREYLPINNCITIGFTKKKDKYNISIYIPDRRLIHPFIDEDIYNLINTFYKIFVKFINNDSENIIFKRKNITNYANLYKLPIWWSLWLVNLPFTKKNNLKN